MAFYTTNDDGSIAAAAGFKFSDDCLEADREIVRGYDGKMYFADEVPEPTPEEIAAQEEAAAAAEKQQQAKEFLLKLMEEGGGGPLSEKQQEERDFLQGLMEGLGYRGNEEEEP